jgi:DNA mismatch repair protein MutS
MEFINTDLHNQYIEVKNEYPYAVLLYQYWNSYVVFGIDAITVAEILNVKLEYRLINDVPGAIEYVSIPYESMWESMEKLVEKNITVAVCDNKSGGSFTDVTRSVKWKSLFK